MSPAWIFLFLVLFCVYILLGLHLTENLDNLPELVLNWVIYTILWVTFINIFTLGYFWSVVKDKRGPAGIRGPSGDRGGQGTNGQCSVESDQAFSIKMINEYINQMFKEKKNKDILDEELQTFPNKYLNNKVRMMFSSKQFNNLRINQNKSGQSLDSLNTYIKSIWKKWFDLLYNATDVPGEWFEDEYGDEEYNWKDINNDEKLNNPFTEIRKYDIYYWGITPNFRPLKAEICRSSDINFSAKLPIPNKDLTPILKIIETNDYIKLGDDDNSGGEPDAWFWRPKKVTIGADEYFPVGDITTNTDNFRKITTQVDRIEYDSATLKPIGPKMKTILVAGDIKDPIGSKSLGGSGGDDDINNNELICPTGYVSMGDFMETDSSRGNLRGDKNLKCVPEKCVETITNISPSRIWLGPKWKLGGGILKKKRGRQPAGQFVLNKNENTTKISNYAYNLFRADLN